MVTVDHDETPVEIHISPTESCSTNHEDMIAREVKSAVKDLVANELSTMIEELLDDILRKSLQNGQMDIRAVVYNTVDQVMLDVLHTDVNGDTLDAHIANFFDTDAAIDRLSQRWLTSNPFMLPIPKLGRKQNLYCHKAEITELH